jgi:hypothetical protein
MQEQLLNAVSFSEIGLQTYLRSTILIKFICSKSIIYTIVSTESKTVVIKLHTMEIYMGREGIAPCILNLGTSCR